MECGICLNDTILEKDMHYTECLHSLCFKCFKKLLVDKCPFCRRNITIIKGLRINRHQYKRNKKERRMNRLNNLILQNEKVNILPNIHKRSNRKIRHL